MVLYQSVKERLFFVSDAKISPLFRFTFIGNEGKIPKWNEWNEKVIFSGTSGIISSVIPSTVRSTEGKIPGQRIRIVLSFPCSSPFRFAKEIKKIPTQSGWIELGMISGNREWFREWAYFSSSSISFIATKICFLNLGSALSIKLCQSITLLLVGVTWIGIFFTLS